MIEFACQYSIVRFLPYAETGEFANVGIVLACPDLRFLEVRIAPARRTKRITDFFDTLDAAVYRETIKFFRAEMDGVNAFMQENHLVAGNGTIAAFDEVIRPREALLRFSPPRAVLTTDPATTLKKLYGYFIEREFATREYHEELLNKGVAKLLKNAALKGYFENAQVGDDTVNVRFPFVHMANGRPELAIKPLHLDRDQASKVIDHGGPWVDRIRRLKKHRLSPKAMLFAVKTPVEGKQRHAAQEIIGDLKELGVTVRDVHDESAIIKFADMARVQ
jgi:hypothetical protein